MRHFKLFFAALALMLTTSTFATTNWDLKTNRGNITYEIQKMLKNSELLIEEEFTVKVFFKVTEDRKIDIRKVESPYENVNAFLHKRLHNQKLNGQSWDAGKIYELPVKVKARQ